MKPKTKHKYQQRREGSEREKLYSRVRGENVSNDISGKSEAASHQTRDNDFQERRTQTNVVKTVDYKPELQQRFFPFF